MPTEREIEAATKALHAIREKSRVGGSKWPSIEEEVRIVLEAAESVRSVTRNPGTMPKTNLIPEE